MNRCSQDLLYAEDLVGIFYSLCIRSSVVCPKSTSGDISVIKTINDLFRIFCLKEIYISSLWR